MDVVFLCPVSTIAVRVPYKGLNPERNRNGVPRNEPIEFTCSLRQKQDYAGLVSVISTVAFQATSVGLNPISRSK